MNVTTALRNVTATNINNMNNQAYGYIAASIITAIFAALCIYQCCKKKTQPEYKQKLFIENADPVMTGALFYN